jgi:uncharacterized protein (UPF0335 family)
MTDIIKTGMIKKEELMGFIERIERMEEDIAAIRSDIKEVYAQAKSTGYEPKIIKQIIKLRKIAEAERVQADEELETYRIALNV